MGGEARTQLLFKFRFPLNKAPYPLESKITPTFFRCKLLKINILFERCGIP